MVGGLLQIRVLYIYLCIGGTLTATIDLLKQHNVDHRSIRVVSFSHNVFFHLTVFEAKET